MSDDYMDLIEAGLNPERLAAIIDLTLGVMPNKSSPEFVYLQNYLEVLRDICEEGE